VKEVERLERKRRPIDGKLWSVGIFRFEKLPIESNGAFERCDASF